MTEDIEIIIEEDTAPEVVVEGEKTPKVVTPEEGIDQLKANLEASKREAETERNARAEAERRAAQSAGVAERATKEVQDTNLTLVTNAIETIKQSSEMLKANYAAALAAGDHNEVAEIQFKMSESAAKLMQLEAGKAELEIEAKRPAPVRQEQADPVERVAAQLSPRSAAWIRAHPEYARTQEAYQKVVRADAGAWGAGIERDTPEYFEHVERALGLKADDAPVREEGRRSAPPAAPVNRQPVTAEGGRKETIRLSREEVEMAENMGLTPQEYAANKKMLKDTGRMQ